MENQNNPTHALVNILAANFAKADFTEEFCKEILKEDNIFNFNKYRITTLKFIANSIRGKHEEDRVRIMRELTCLEEVCLYLIGTYNEMCQAYKAIIPITPEMANMVIARTLMEVCGDPTGAQCLIDALFRLPSSVREGYFQETTKHKDFEILSGVLKVLKETLDSTEFTDACYYNEFSKNVSMRYQVVHFDEINLNRNVVNKYVNDVREALHDIERMPASKRRIIEGDFEIDLTADIISSTLLLGLLIYVKNIAG